MYIITQINTLIQNFKYFSFDLTRVILMQYQTTRTFFALTEIFHTKNQPKLQLILPEFRYCFCVHYETQPNVNYSARVVH